MSMTHEELARAAHTLTDVEPPADLEARIKRRLDDVVTVAPPRWWPRYLYAAAGLSAVIIATLVVQGPEIPESRSPRVQGPIVQGPVVQGPESAVQSPPSGGQVVVLPSERPALSQAELAWMARRIPALETIEALTVDQIVFDSIQPEPLSITPLTMTPLTVSPVTGDADAGRSR